MASGGIGGMDRVKLPAPAARSSLFTNLSTSITIN